MMPRAVHDLEGPVRQISSNALSDDVVVFLDGSRKSILGKDEQRTGFHRSLKVPKTFR